MASHRLLPTYEVSHTRNLRVIGSVPTLHTRVGDADGRRLAGRLDRDCSDRDRNHPLEVLASRRHGAGFPSATEQMPGRRRGYCSRVALDAAACQAGEWTEGRRAGTAPASEPTSPPQLQSRGGLYLGTPCSASRIGGCPHRYSTGNLLRRSSTDARLVGRRVMRLRPPGRARCRNRPRPKLAPAIRNRTGELPWRCWGDTTSTRIARETASGAGRDAGGGRVPRGGFRQVRWRLRGRRDNRQGRRRRHPRPGRCSARTPHPGERGRTNVTWGAPEFPAEHAAKGARTQAGDAPE